MSIFLSLFGRLEVFSNAYFNLLRLFSALAEVPCLCFMSLTLLFPQ